MISKGVRIQLVLFAILSLTAALTIVFRYADVPGNLGFGKQRLTAIFTDGAGIYKNSNVSVRGVEIGEVTAVRLVPGGVAVDMSLDDDVAVGADARAEIHSVSAVGEQYVDIISEQSSGPLLKDGDVIPISRTSVPQQIAPVLDKTDILLASIPREGLQTFLDEGYKAFHDLGPSLGQLVDSATAFVDEADQNYAPTEQMINNLGPLLDTQNIAADSVRAYFANLAGFTGALRDEDNALRHGLPEVDTATHAIAKLFRMNENGLPFLVDNTRTLAQLLQVYRPGLEQVLVTYPQVLAWEQIVTRDRQSIKVALSGTLLEGCTTGYNTVNRRSPFDLTDKPSEADTYCKVPQNDPRLVRGVRNVPCQEGVKGRRAATVQQCRGDRGSRNGYQPAAGSGGPVVALDRPGLPGADLEPSGERPLSGPPGASEPLFMFGAIGTKAPEGRDNTWEALLTRPVGR